MRRRSAAAAIAFTALLGLGRQDQSSTPGSLVASYLKYLGADQPYTAVDDCFDAHQFAMRVFGSDLDALDPGRVAYVDQLASVAIKATLSRVPMGRILPSAMRTQFSVTENFDDASVTFTLALPTNADQPAVAAPADEPRPDTRQHPVSMVLHRSQDGWRIADLEPTASLWRDGYTAAKAKGQNPLDFMESMTQALIAAKHAPK